MGNDDARTMPVIVGPTGLRLYRLPFVFRPYKRCNRSPPLDGARGILARRHIIDRQTQGLGDSPRPSSVQITMPGESKHISSMQDDLNGEGVRRRGRFRKLPWAESPAGWGEGVGGRSRMPSAPIRRQLRGGRQAVFSVFFISSMPTLQRIHRSRLPPTPKSANI